MATIVEEHNHAQKLGSKISIRPYATESDDNMGLRDYGMVLFEGVFHEEQLACLERNGIKRYITGLNEFAPEIKTLGDEQREAKIKEIRKIVAQLEAELAGNIISEDDMKSKDFWNKVQLLKPNNSDFWDKIVMRVGNDPIFLDPKTDPYDLIKIKAIEAGGFSMIAPSMAEARKRGRGTKFYLDKFVETVSLKTEIKKVRNKALAALEKMFNKNQNKLFYVCKVVDGNPTQYKKSTPNDVMYDNMDSFINGEGYEKNKKKSATLFLEAASLDMEELQLRAIMKDANFYKIISTKSDGFIYHLASNTMMGKNPSEILLFMKDPINEEILNEMRVAVEKYWNL
jgi:hypothetical protein